MASSWRRQTPLTAAFICFALAQIFPPSWRSKVKSHQPASALPHEVLLAAVAKLRAGTADVSRLLAVKYGARFTPQMKLATADVTVWSR